MSLNCNDNPDGFQSRKEATKNTKNTKKLLNDFLSKQNLVVQEALKSESTDEMEHLVSQSVAERGFQSSEVSCQGMAIQKMLRFYIEHDLSHSLQWLPPINSDMKSDLYREEGLF